MVYAVAITTQAAKKATTTVVLAFGKVTMKENEEGEVLQLGEKNGGHDGPPLNDSRRAPTSLAVEW